MQTLSPSNSMHSRKLAVVHILSGDRWAGAEVQAFTLLRQIKQHTNLHVILMNEGELARRCSSLDIATTIFDESKLSSPTIFNALRRHLDRLKPDVVHTHRQKENIFGSIANLATCRAKCVRTVHGAPEFTPTGKQKLQVRLDALCGRYLQDAIIAVSDDLRGKLAPSFPGRKLHVIANGIDPEEVTAGITNPDFKQCAPHALHIGLVGRLDPVKRVDIFLEMAAILLKEKPELPWMFHIFGEGGQEAAMKQLARDLEVNERTQFHGHRSDIRSCMAALNAVVMPSDHEGLPMAALEALALAVPLVAHKTGGLTELLKDCKDCLVSSHTARHYANALNKVLLAGRPSTRLDSKYLASGNGEKVLALYNKL